MKPSQLTTGICLTTSLLLSGCPDTRTPSPSPMVPKPKALSLQSGTPEGFSNSESMSSKAMLDGSKRIARSEAGGKGSPV